MKFITVALCALLLISAISANEHWGHDHWKKHNYGYKVKIHHPITGWWWSGPSHGHQSHWDDSDKSPKGWWGHHEKHHDKHHDTHKGWWGH